MPSRSFYYKGNPIPLCARCTGIFVGSFISIFYMLIFRYYSIWFLLAFIPMGMDWGLNYLKITKGSNIRRFVTGFLTGFVATCTHIFLFIALIKYVIVLYP